MASKNSGNIIITPEPGELKITPLAMAIFSSDLSIIINNKDISINFRTVKHFLICLAIELGMKSALCNNKYTNSKLIKLGHNLESIAKAFNKISDNIVSGEDISILQEMNKFYCGDRKDKKSIVYAGPYLKEQILKGYKDMPNINALEQINQKIQNFINSTVLTQDE